MLYWIRYPFIRITASFAAGILFNYYTNVSLKLSVILLVASIFSLWVTRRYWKKNRFHQFNLIISFLAFSNIFLLGSLCLHCRNPALNKHHILRIPDEFDHYVLRVTDVPDTSGSWAKFPGEIQLIHHTAKWHKAGGKLLVYIPESVTVHFGDRLLIQGMPQRIKPPLNPDEFDYQLFMQHKGIFFHHFIQPGSFVNLESKHRFSFYGISLKARNGIAQILTERFSDTPTRGIMLALLTGQRQYIDPETYGRFIQIGVVHTLAVSGLHVGIIYMFLVMLFKPFHRHTWSKKICLGLKIIVLLFFAFLTGLSPSVLRATLMFSAMILGKILNRNSHVLNSVFLSAFLLLCIDPYLLYDLGFQLSYSAVTGIILFQPLIFNIFPSKHPIIDWLWRLISVSVSAQLGTLPFSLFYFNRFPTYFLLGNLVAIPYVTFSIIGGLILVIFSPVKILTTLLVFLLDTCSSLFLKFLLFVQSVPYGIIEPIPLYASQAVMLSIAILSVYIMIRKRKWRFGLITTACLLGITSIDLYYQCKLHQEKQIIVYHVPGISCIELVDGYKGTMLLQIPSKDQKSKIDFHTRNHIIRNKRDIELCQYSHIPARFPAIISSGFVLFTWNGKSIVLWYKKCNLNQLKCIRGDYLIISNNMIRPRNLVELNLQFDHVILDSSNHSFPYTSYGSNAITGERPNPNIGSRNRLVHLVGVDGPYIDHIK